MDSFSFEFTGTKSDFPALEAIGSKKVELPKKGLHVHLVALEALEECIQEASRRGENCQKIKAGLDQLKNHQEIQGLFAVKIAEVNHIYVHDARFSGRKKGELDRLKSALQELQYEGDLHEFKAKSDELQAKMLENVGRENPIGFLCNIRTFALGDEAKRIRIAKFYARLRGDEVARNISAFGIEDPMALIEIAKLCSTHQAVKTAEFIDRFGIEDQKALMEIAKLVIEQGGEEAIEYISHFDIDDPSFFIQLAKIADPLNEKRQAQTICRFAGNKGETVMKAAQDPSISEELLFELLQFVLKYRPSLIDEIRARLAQDEGALVKLMKSMAGSNDRERVRAVCKAMDQVQDPIARIEILKLAAERTPSEVIESLDRISIEDPKEVIEILKICAKRGTSALPKKVSKLAILEEKDRIEIAKIYAQYNPKMAANSIQDFKIISQEALIAIAEICAKGSGVDTACCIKDFNIISPEARIKIAKLAIDGSASYSPDENPNPGVVKYIDNFDIKDPVALCEQVKLCAVKDGMMTAKLIQKFSIKDGELLIEIAKLCAKQNGNMAAYIRPLA